VCVCACAWVCGCAGVRVCVHVCGCAGVRVQCGCAAITFYTHREIEKERERERERGYLALKCGEVWWRRRRRRVREWSRRAWRRYL
jgi:hypothetical protein